MSGVDGPVAVDAPAKVNLALHVTGRRADGYHDLDTLALFADEVDIVTAQRAEADNFSVSGPFGAALGDGGANLVLAARDWFRQRLGAGTQPVDLHLTKILPVAAGLGGGSADAAATLKAMERVLGVDLRDHVAELEKAAAELGADVPMCLRGTPLRADGIGENIMPLAGVPPLDAVLVNCGQPVSTPQVFKALSNRDNARLPDMAEKSISSAEEFCAWLAAETRNDLTEPAMQLCPAIGDSLDALRQHNPLLARMSGSGATCFAVFADAQTCRAVAGKIENDHPGWWVRATRLRGNGEAKGKAE